MGMCISCEFQNGKCTLKTAKVCAVTQQEAMRLEQRFNADLQAQLTKVEGQRDRAFKLLLESSDWVVAFGEQIEEWATIGFIPVGNRLWLQEQDAQIMRRNKYCCDQGKQYPETTEAQATERAIKTLQESEG